MDPKKFKLSDAVGILIDRQRSALFKTWALARLLAWMCLDQRPGTRKRNPKTGHKICSTRQRRDAKAAGHLALAVLLDRRLKLGAFDNNDDTLAGMLALFVHSGGFGLFLETPRGGRRWLSKMKASTTQLMYVHKIVDYLCRCQKVGITQSKCNIECAKKFIQKIDEELTARTLGKYWEKSKQAAPYVFAFYPFLASALDRATSIHQFVDALEQLAKNDTQLEQLLGEAAHAADILAPVAHKVRVQDFKDVTRAPPRLAAFTPDESQIIDVIDATRPLAAKDLEDYRPETITRVI